MSIAIQGAEILTLEPASDAKAIKADILIKGDRIEAIGPDLDLTSVREIINGTGKLVMPGLVNAHMHSPEALYKGRYDNMPLEIWMLYAYPILGAQMLSPRMVYLRTALCAIESLKTGTTCVTDDVYESPSQTTEQLEAVFQAYEDVGLRATVSGHVVNRPFLDTIPFTKEFVDPKLAAQAATLGTADKDAWLEYCRTAFKKHHGRAGRLNFMVAPSPPQRCTLDLMQDAMSLAEEYDAPFHTHILETKLQAVTGQEFYGETLIAFMDRHGLLKPRTTIAHSIWVTDSDMEMMGEVGCSIVHNVISNQKLGAGVAPVQRLLRSGVNVALGSDGISTSDTARMFAVLHAAGLIHNVQSPDPNLWLSAGQVLAAATLGGAKSACMGDQTGTLSVGKKADLLVLDLKSIPFTPLNDIANHLVYCETGSSILFSIVNGEIMAKDGKCLRVDEASLLEELRSEMPAFESAHAKTENLNRAFEDSFWKIHKKANKFDFNIKRLGNEPAWPS